eukprot:scaffold166592_cov55-Attheya_sp.AAC.8
MENQEHPMILDRIGHGVVVIPMIDILHLHYPLPMHASLRTRLPWIHHEHIPQAMEEMSTRSAPRSIQLCCKYAQRVLWASADGHHYYFLGVFVPLKEAALYDVFLRRS